MEGIVKQLGCRKQGQSCFGFGLLGFLVSGFCCYCSCSVVYTLLSSCRRMRQSQKTVYQMCRAMNMPGSFWLMHQLKDFGCLLGERSKLCSVSENGFE